MKTKSEKRAKAQRIKEKLSIRAIGKTTPREKKGATGEFELFKRIAIERQQDGLVPAKHISMGGEVCWNGKEDMKTMKGLFCYKFIPLQDLTPTNFSHIKPKGMYPELRLNPDNIEIVSRAYHEWQHTRQIAQVNYPN